MDGYKKKQQHKDDEEFRIQTQVTSDLTQQSDTTMVHKETSQSDERAVLFWSDTARSDAAQPEAVPVCASAPGHLLAPVRTSFEHDLTHLRTTVAANIAAVSTITSDPQLTATVTGALSKFGTYARIREEDLNGTAPAILSVLNKALADTVSAMSMAIKTLGELNRKIQDAIKVHLKDTTPSHSAANESITVLGEQLRRHQQLERLLSPYQDLLRQDNMTGSLISGRQKKYTDSQITIGKDESKTDSATGITKTVSFSWKDKTKEPLFKKPPAVSDIRQGGLGDCYLLAGLATIVATDPSLITGAMKDLGDEVCVRFYGGIFPTYITVKKTVPIRETERKRADGTVAGTSQSDAFANDTLWVQMIEKAYTASGLRTGYASPAAEYQNIAGGLSEVFIQQLTGKAPQTFRMTNDAAQDSGNSLIGAYKDRYGLLEDFTGSVARKISGLITAGHNGVPRDTLRRAAKGVYLRHQASGLRVEEAVSIVLEMAKSEEAHKKDFSYTDTAGTTVRGKRLERASFLDELHGIVSAAAITVPPGHIPDAAVLVRLAAENNIFIAPTDGLFAGDLFDEQTIAATADREHLAERIRLLYNNGAQYLSIDESIRLAEAYETHYKKNIAEDMIRLLKKDEHTLLSYSPFYTKRSKSGADKPRYTRQAKQKYRQIEEAVNSGKLITAGTVEFAKKGDSHKKDGLVESHAYSVLGTEEIAGVSYVRVRNPWGEYERVYDAAHRASENTGAGTDGIFLMELNDFISNFSILMING